MSNQKNNPTVDWYDRRDELRQDMVFRTYAGDIVRLDRTVPGDGTRWYVEDWTGYWAHESSTIEPGDLAEYLPDFNGASV